ncbi:MAG: hypothetical protein QOH60_2590 [Mycobacterium sp.]|nr:hypothetical protein [Mycobacterium sp.]
MGCLVAFTLAACDSVDPQTAAKSVADVVLSQKGFRPNDVTCPRGVDATLGTKFDCTFTDPTGKKITAHLKITKVDDDHVEFDVVLPAT